HVIERAPGSHRKGRLLCDLKRCEVRNNKLRLIVKHFFEVRDEPVFIDRVAMKTAAQLIIHSTLFHREQRLDNHVASLTVSRPFPEAQEEIVPGGPRKFGRGAKSPKLRIEGAPQLLEGAVRDGDIDPIQPRS